MSDDMNIGLGSDSAETVTINSSTTSSPTDDFNHFQCNVEETSIDDLRHDVVALDNSLDRQLALHDVTPSASEVAVQDIYDKISKKYGVQVGYASFKDFIHDVANNSVVQKEMLDAINAKVTTSIVQRTQLRIALSLSKLIDRMLTLVEKESDETEILTPEIVGSIDRALMYYQQLADIRDGITIQDPDRALERLSEKANGNKLEVKKDSSASVELVNNILSQLNG